MTTQFMITNKANINKIAGVIAYERAMETMSQNVKDEDRSRVAAMQAMTLAVVQDRVSDAMCLFSDEDQDEAWQEACYAADQMVAERARKDRIVAQRRFDRSKFAKH